MSHFRAVKAGNGKDCQVKIDTQFNVNDAVKCLTWIKEESGENFEVVRSDNRIEVIDHFHAVLKDGLILCKIVNKYLEGDSKLNFNSKTFKKSTNPNFEANRERERLDKFLSKCLELGIARDSLFQIENLYEYTNFNAVYAGIGALGSEIESRPQFKGTPTWPKKFVDKKAEERREKAKAANKKSYNYSGILFGAPTE